MADAGPSGGVPVDAPAAWQNEEFKRMMEVIMWGSRRIGQLRDLKSPKKRKSEPNKKLEALKKKRAKDKAELVKTREQLRELQRQQKLINAKKRVEMRRSKDEKDQELIRKLEAETRNSSGLVEEPAVG